jgi:hypothetical protein
VEVCIKLVKPAPVVVVPWFFIVAEKVVLAFKIAGVGLCKTLSAVKSGPEVTTHEKLLYTASLYAPLDILVCIHAL